MITKQILKALILITIAVWSSIGTILAAEAAANNESNDDVNLACPQGYHIEARDGKGTEQCIIDDDMQCPPAHYLNTNDQCVDNRACAFTKPKPYECAVPEKPKSLDIDCDKNPDHAFCTGEKGRDGLPFCDLPSHPGSCYDRNDNPESYCANYGEKDSDFCELIGEICDDERNSNSIKSTDPECTEEGLPCPEDYIRYDKYCARFRADCDLNPANVYCNGEKRIDGLIICDRPSHPGYKFCKNNDDN
jgi:hypothetical protein